MPKFQQTSVHKERMRQAPLVKDMCIKDMGDGMCDEGYVYLVTSCVQPGLEGLSLPEAVVVNLVSPSHHDVQVLFLMALQHILPEQGRAPHLDICVDRQAIAAVETPVDWLIDGRDIKGVPGTRWA